ncbi:S-adenosyl-L-methionine-dependent methyltransferase [Infundibulicybe gibba]|nr:S-adenosyl-L-methionine-dependent methyltransferase [Infundibulicybe gibba]
MLSKTVLEVGYDLLDKGLVPDFILRRVIRALLRQRLREIDHGSFEANHAAKMKWIEEVRARTTIAELTEKANEQHYECVSTNFILSTLGPFGKYSSCLYPTGKESLAQAETLMLESYCEKAQLKDGLDILDLGCGMWSDLCLAQKYPNSRVTGLSNSTTQKTHIDSAAKERGLTNLEIITADVNTHDFNGSKHFDRILSIEMFEHMKNYQTLLHKVSTWLRPKSRSESNDEALLFIHIFCHRTTPYHYEEDDGWMAQNFFSGGTMPSHDLFLYFQSDLTLLRSWYLSGTHYSRTLEDWLTLQDKNGKVGLKELEADAVAKGKDAVEGRKAFYRFRVFYLACSELFNMDGGQQWGVGHYLFKAKE